MQSFDSAIVLAVFAGTLFVLCPSAATMVVSSGGLVPALGRLYQVRTLTKRPLEQPRGFGLGIIRNGSLTISNAGLKLSPLTPVFWFMQSKISPILHRCRAVRSYRAMYAVAVEIENSDTPVESLKQSASKVATILRPIIDYPLAPAATLKEADDSFKALTRIIETIARE